MHQPSLLAVLTAALAALPAAQAAGMYTKSSPVLQVDAKSFSRLIEKSNQTSIVEFYAPWCGHCQNLKPAYEKAAKNLDGLAKVAAVDCDDDANKGLCAAQGVQGFPTIKTFRPGKKAGGKPVVEDYRGPRTATAMTEEVVNKINNHVTRLTDGELDGFLGGDGAKAILFTEKGTTSALIRSIAIDYLDVIKVGQIRNKEKKAVEKFGIEKFPSLVLVPGDASEPVVYQGELNKKDMVDFLRQAGEPNPDPAPAKSKADKKKDAKKTEEKAKQPEPEEAPEASTADATADAAEPSFTPAFIEPIALYDALAEHCLQPKSHTCLLVHVPAGSSEAGDKAIVTASQLNVKHENGPAPIFPLYSLADDVAGVSTFKSALGLKGEVEIIAINARRKWWKQYDGDLSAASISGWMDAIRLGDGAKHKLPAELVAEAGQPKTDESSSEPTQATDPEPEIETESPEEKIVHEEL